MRLQRIAVGMFAGAFMLCSATAMLGQRSSGSPSSAQGTLGSQTPLSPTGPVSPVGLSDDPMKDRVAAMEVEQAKARNNERQQKLIDDTNQLLQLATQLKNDVDKTNKDTLSIDVIKKADEIEKLAKSVKDRMKGSG